MLRFHVDIYKKNLKKNDSGYYAIEQVLPLINPIYWMHAGGLA